MFCGAVHLIVVLNGGWAGVILKTTILHVSFLVWVLLLVIANAFLALLNSESTRELNMCSSVCPIRKVFYF